MLAILSLTFALLEHILSFKMTPYSLKVISTKSGIIHELLEILIVTFLNFFAACFHLFLENISAVKSPFSVCCITNGLFYYQILFQQQLQAFEWMRQ